MPPRRRLRPVPWSGVVYRASSYDSPLWARPNRRDGRWNVAGEGSTQYFCCDGEAPFAELLRHERISTDSEAAQFRTTIWQVRVDETAIADYSDFEKAERAGFPPDALVDNDWSRCQAEAQRLRKRAIAGVLSPSAALPGSVNLTLFGPRVPVPWNTQLKLASVLPVQRIATGAPPAGLAARTLMRGAAHPLLAAYRSGT